jgi:hypothetical protein
MRNLWTVLLAGLCLTAGLGCSLDSLFRRAPRDAPPDPPQVNANAAQLIDYLNTHARDLRVLSCQSLSAEVSAAGQGGNVHGYLHCRQPRDFRLVGKAMGMEEVDIGSNDDEFWFWIKRSEPTPRVFFCKHADLKAGVRLPFPIQPDYISEALGMATYGPAQNYRLKEINDTYHLSTDVLTPAGEPARKVTIFAKWQATKNRPQVLEYRLEHPNGRLICSARIDEVQTDRSIWYPSRVTLSCPDEKMEVKLTLKQVAVNVPIPPDRAERLFSRMSLAQWKAVDLARGPDPAPNNGVRRARGAMR